MAQYKGNTSMGGVNTSFPFTDWSQIHKAQNGDQLIRQQLFNKLAQYYWKPAYCYLRKRGCNDALAKDITQDFFHKIVFEGKLIEHANRQKGRFRDFLKVSLRHYSGHYQFTQTTISHIPQNKVVPIDKTDELELPQQEDMNDDQAFDYGMTVSILDTVLEEVKEHFMETGKSTHWYIFYERKIIPIIDCIYPLSFKELCQKYDVKNENTASTMVTTVKRRYRAILKHKIQQLEQSVSNTDEELNRLKELLQKKSPSKNDPEENEQ